MTNVEGFSKRGRHKALVEDSYSTGVDKNATVDRFIGMILIP